MEVVSRAGPTAAEVRSQVGKGCVGIAGEDRADYDTDAKEEREEAKQEEGPAANGQVRVAPPLPAGSTGEAAKEDQRSAREGSTQPAKAAPMAMRVGETEITQAGHVKVFEL